MRSSSHLLQYRGLIKVCLIVLVIVLVLAYAAFFTTTMPALHATSSDSSSTQQQHYSPHRKIWSQLEKLRQAQEAKERRQKEQQLPPGMMSQQQTEPPEDEIGCPAADAGGNDGGDEKDKDDNEDDEGNDGKEGDDDNRHPAVVLRSEYHYPPPQINPACTPTSLCRRYVEERKILRRRASSSDSERKAFQFPIDHWWRDTSQEGGRIERDPKAHSNSLIAVATLFSRPTNKHHHHHQEQQQQRGDAKGNKNTKDVIKSSSSTTTTRQPPPPSSSPEDAFDDDALINKKIPSNYFAQLRGDIVNQKWWWRRMHFASFVNKALYCLRRKYDLIVEGDAMVDRRRNSPAWSKILVLQKWLSSYEYIMWMDADAFFTRMRVPLATFLPRRKDAYNNIREDRDGSLESAYRNPSDNFILFAGDKGYDRSHADVLMAKDYRSWNTGVFFIRHSDWSQSFLKQLWAVSDEQALPFHDQGAVLHVTDTDKVDRHTATVNAFHMFETEAKQMNAYPVPLLTELQDESRRNDYEFIAGLSTIGHFPSCIKYQTCPAWIEFLFSQGMCSSSISESSAMGVPPPPSVLKKFFNISIGESSFRILGGRLEKPMS